MKSIKLFLISLVVVVTFFGMSIRKVMATNVDMATMFGFNIHVENERRTLTSHIMMSLWKSMDDYLKYPNQPLYKCYYSANHVIPQGYFVVLTINTEVEPELMGLFEASLSYGGKETTLINQRTKNLTPEQIEDFEDMDPIVKKNNGYNSARFEVDTSKYQNLSEDLAINIKMYHWANKKTYYFFIFSISTTVEDRECMSLPLFVVEDYDKSGAQVSGIICATGPNSGTGIKTPGAYPSDIAESQKQYIDSRVASNTVVKTNDWSQVGINDPIRLLSLEQNGKKIILGDLPYIIFVSKESFKDYNFPYSGETLRSSAKNERIIAGYHMCFFRNKDVNSKAIIFMK